MLIPPYLAYRVAVGEFSLSMELAVLPLALDKRRRQSWVQALSKSFSSSDHLKPLPQSWAPMQTYCEDSRIQYILQLSSISKVTDWHQGILDSATTTSLVLAVAQFGCQFFIRLKGERLALRKSFQRAKASLSLWKSFSVSVSKASACTSFSVQKLVVRIKYKGSLC